MVNIRVNGEPRQVAEQASIADLLGELAVTTRYVAVEVNEQVVPLARHAGHCLAEGDRVEIVTLVGGG